MISIRKLFIIDSICGLIGTLIYFIFFDFIISNFSIPRDIVLTQLIANFSYTLFGAFLYLSQTKNIKYFKFLMWMNFIYAVLCMSASLILIINQLYLGFVLLAIEGLLIFFLALWEHKVILLVARKRNWLQSSILK